MNSVCSVQTGGIKINLIFWAVGQRFAEIELCGVGVGHAKC